MSLVQPVPFILVVGALGICAYYFVRPYTSRHQASLVGLFILALSLLLLGLISITFSRQLVTIIRLAGTAAMVYAVLASYYCWHFFFRDDPVTFPRDAFITGVSACLAGILLLDFLRGERAPSLLLPEMLDMSGAAYGYNVGLFLLLIGIKARVIKLLADNLHARKADLSFTVRRELVLAGFVLALVSDASMIAKAIYIFEFKGNPQQHAWSWFFFGTAAIETMLFFLSVLPQPIFAMLLVPFERRKQRQLQEEELLLASLHEVLTRLVPAVRLVDGYLSPKRMLVEIGNARRIIGTTMPQENGRVTVDEEAQHIKELLARGKTITAGSHPIFPKVEDARGYYLELARTLRSLGVL